LVGSPAANEAGDPAPPDSTCAKHGAGFAAERPHGGFNA